MRNNPAKLCAMLLIFAVSFPLSVADAGTQVVLGPNGNVAGVIVHHKRHRHHHHKHKHPVAATLSYDVSSVYQRIMYYRHVSQAQKSSGRSQAQAALRAQ